MSAKISYFYLKAIVFTMLLQIVPTEITEKHVQREREREREHFVWEEIMAIHYDKNKNK